MANTPETKKRYTYAVTKYSFLSTGVVEGEEIATGLTRKEVVESYPDAKILTIRDMNRKNDPGIEAETIAFPEWY